MEFNIFLFSCNIPRYTMYLATLALSIILLFEKTHSTQQISIEKTLNVPFWQEVDRWSSCSTSCGEGIQEKHLECFKKTFYLEENIDIEKCQNIKKPKSKMRKCNYGNCDQSYVWKITEWGKCSHTCGYAGVQMNEVECFVKIEGNKYAATDHEKCEESLRPKSLRSCNRFNCPVQFQPQKWGNCIKTNDCYGKQRRNLTCISLLNTGKIFQLPAAACYLKVMIPPSSWRKCFEDIDEDMCFKTKKVMEPVITEVKRTLVQMRRVSKLDLQVGHISYIIPATKVMVTCPVQNFLKINLIWVHKYSKYSYNGKSKNRIKVNKKGKLTIKSFQSQDQGEWICKANNVTASVVMKLKSPSDGFKDWAIRNTLWNREMPNEDSQMDMMNQEVIRWVSGAWSQCSISCGGNGIQNRFVKCEKLENRYYYPLDDTECLKRFGVKPIITSKCLQKYSCPKWTLMNKNNELCTDNCINFGKGSIAGDLRCMFKNNTVDYKKCDQNKKPFLECDNPKCTVKWKISSWTKCSRSCGDAGIKARYLICIWSISNDLAGNLCYKAGLEVPRVIKVCKPPKCNIECVDLSKNCYKKQNYCYLGMYHFRCCKTCQGYFRSMRNKP